MQKKAETNSSFHLPVFQEHRQMLFSVAYRMMGSHEDAQDLLQETYIKFSDLKLEEIRNPRGFLVTIITRLAIDAKRSAYEKKRTYPGPWLPEPILDGFEESMVLSETAGAAFLFLLEQLSPVERAVIVLRDVFDYEYSEISGIVERKTDHCRKIAERARKRIRQEKRKEGSTLSEYAQNSTSSVAGHMDEGRKRRFLISFQRACNQGDLNSLLGMLTEDILVHTDGGGKVTAAMRTVFGADRASRFFAGLAEKFPNTYTVPVSIGGTFSVLQYDGNDELSSVVQFRMASGRIAEVYAVRNPDKLKAVQRQVRSSLLLRLKVRLYKALSRLI
ncbi:MAG: sigma-70 family RNA polymerase sigma factor [Leptospiraceae bacterium]